MGTTHDSTGLEYKHKGRETPFETFLRYTDEKEKSSQMLAGILQDALTDGSKILDIGSSNGEYLELTLRKITALPAVTLTLVEPSDALNRQLPARFKSLVPASRMQVVASTVGDFASEDAFDVILASHLFYHVPRPTWPAQLGKMLALLKPGGVLIVVLREKDDAYDFKMKFKPQLFSDTSFKALTLDDVLAVLPKETAVTVSRYVAAGTLTIPADTNMDDAIAIIEFYLNKHWSAMPRYIQLAVLAFIKEKQSVFKQRDGIAVIKKA